MAFFVELKERRHRSRLVARRRSVRARDGGAPGPWLVCVDGASCRPAVIT
jgi:hypothetical protein